MVVQDETNIQESSINKKSNNTMSIILSTGVTFVKKNFCLVARIVSFDTAGLHLLTCHILELHLPSDIEFDLSQSHVVVEMLAPPDCFV